MIMHISVLRWKPEATPEQIDRIAERLARLPERIPEIVSYSFGSDLGLGVGNASFAVVAEFESRDAYEIYRDHPDHRAVLSESILPVLAERTAVQFEVSAGD